MGFYAASLVAFLLALYAIVLSIGILTLSGPEEPISDPWFTAMELLILMMMPAIVAMSVAVHGTSNPERRPAALAAVVFASMLAVTTSAAHFLILTLSREPEFADLESVFAFRWPSVVYALDILAWDGFYALFATSLALAIESAAIRRLLFASAILAFVGFGGVFAGNMAIRNIGIAGYVVLFFPAVVLLALQMRRMGTAA